MRLEPDSRVIPPFALKRVASPALTRKLTPVRLALTLPVFVGAALLLALIAILVIVLFFVMAVGGEVTGRFSFSRSERKESQWKS